MGLDVDENFENLHAAQSIPIFSIEDLGISDKDGEKKNLLECLARNKETDPQISYRLEK